MTQIDLQVLRSAQLFEGLSDDTLARFADVGSPRRCAAGDVVFVEMSDADEIFLIADGTVTAELALANADEYFEIITLGAGEILGEMGFVEDGQHSATVVAAEDVELIVWKSAAWRKICDDDPAVGYQLMLRIARVLCSRLRRWNERMLDSVAWGLP